MPTESGAIVFPGISHRQTCTKHAGSKHDPVLHRSLRGERGKTKKSSKRLYLLDFNVESYLTSQNT